MSATPSRAELEALWMPFTANRQFKANPRLLARAEGMHYWTPDGRRMLDGVAGSVVRECRARSHAKSARR